MKNSPDAAAAGLKIDMAAYIVDAAVCHSLQAAAVAIHKRLRLLCRAFLSHKRAHCGFFDRLKGERVVRPPFCVDSAPAGMRHIRAMRPPRKERSGAHCRIERSYRGVRRGLLRKARCRASPLRAAGRCLRSISRRFARAHGSGTRHGRAAKKEYSRKLRKQGTRIRRSGAAFCERLAAAHRRFEQLADACAAFRGALLGRGSGMRCGRDCEKGIFTKTAERGDAHSPPRRGFLRKARCRASPL